MNISSINSSGNSKFLQWNKLNIPAAICAMCSVHAMITISSKCIQSGESEGGKDKKYQTINLIIKPCIPPYKLPLIFRIKRLYLPIQSLLGDHYIMLMLIHATIIMFISTFTHPLHIILKIHGIRRPAALYKCTSSLVTIHTQLHFMEKTVLIAFSPNFPKISINEFLHQLTSVSIKAELQLF